MGKMTEAQRRDVEAIAAKRDEDIDLSDMPEVSAEAWKTAVRGKFYQPKGRPAASER